MHPRAAAPGDRHTARAGVFSRRRLLAGPPMHKLRNLARCDRRKPQRQVKSSQVKSLCATRNKLLLELYES